ncbi:hypothetical protein E2C01_027273 [Portunus trituberculatus]|uniref:Uncharacterized protein n=1 Tax=Portunus trituberculatus TaxID=210409 RepID=A0A5B7EKE3_PORTR|nr:hypothetical protein [Portunus trituberculatus]
MEIDIHYMGHFGQVQRIPVTSFDDSTESSNKRANLLPKRTGPPAPTEREVAEGVVFGPADSADERAANEA